MKKCISVVFFVFALSSCANALDNGLALTPPMGWVSWARFRNVTDCKNYPDECFSEKLIRRQVDLMVSEGYVKAGYEYIILNGPWGGNKRDENGRLLTDLDRFPYGIKTLADRVHGKGLKLGVQFDFVDEKDFLKHVEIDAKTFAEWGVDYLRLEVYCSKCNIQENCEKMGSLLNATGRPILFACRWLDGRQPNYDVIAEHCNLWRSYKDIDDSWNSVIDIIKWYGENHDNIAKLAGPGRWNHPDSLIIGNFGLSFQQNKAQMALWAILAAPLFMSNDLATIDPRDKEILLNEDVIAINQDKLGIQGRYVTTIDEIHIWTKPILPRNDKYHSHAIAFLSTRVDGIPHAIVIKLSQLKLEAPDGYVVEGMFVEDEGISVYLYPNMTFMVRVKPTSVVLLRARVLCHPGSRSC